MSARLLMTARVLVISFVTSLLVAVAPLTSGHARQPAPETRAETLEGLPEADTAESGEAVAARALTVSEPTTSPLPFSMVGFDMPTEAAIEFRTRAGAGPWTDWDAAEPLEPADGPDPDTQEARRAASGSQFSEPVWVGQADRIQVRAKGASTTDVGVTFIDSMGLSESWVDKASRTFSRIGQPTAAEAAVYSPAVTRRQWGANENWRNGGPRFAKVKFGVLHHTAGTNNYTRSESDDIVRGIYYYHTQTLGWDDIGYNILVDRYGTVYEGRYGGLDRGVVGAHTRGWNTGSFGVSIMGNFDNATPPKAAVRSTVDVIAWKYRVHGLKSRPKATVSHNGSRIRTLSGHRDLGQTACPGRYVYGKMDRIRWRIHSKLRGAWIPVTGDWDGDGTETAGWFHKGKWYLSNRNNSRATGELVFRYGRAGDTPVVGDWNADGTDTVGVVRDAAWYLKDANTGGGADRAFRYGRAGDTPVVGDWNGNLRDTAGVRRGQTWHLRIWRGGGRAQHVFAFGKASDSPVVGDWDGDVQDTVGVKRGKWWYLRDVFAGGAADRSLRYGIWSDLGVVGDWNGWQKGGVNDGIGVVRGTTWYLKNGASEGTADGTFRFAY